MSRCITAGCDNDTNGTSNRCDDCYARNPYGQAIDIIDQRAVERHARRTRLIEEYAGTIQCARIARGYLHGVDDHVREATELADAVIAATEGK